jgi:hypothetical protein
MLARLLVVTFTLIIVAQCGWITKDLQLPRVRPAVAQVANKIYIAGGQIAQGIETASIEVLNTDTFEFEDVNLNLPTPRQQCSAVPIGSKIYFSGGLETKGNLVIFNETSAVFSLLEKAPWVRDVLHLQFLNDTTLCVFGDGSLDIYNTVTKTWTSVEEYRNLVKQIFKFGFGVVNNVAYIVGGVFTHNGTLSSNVWTFDLLSHKLTCHNNSIIPQFFPNGLKLTASANAVIMTGGLNDTVNQLVNILNINTNKWFSSDCSDLNPALNALPLSALTSTHAYIAIDAKDLSLAAKIKLINLATFEISFKSLPLITGAWDSLVTLGDKVLACGNGGLLNIYYTLNSASVSLGLTLGGSAPTVSFELNGKYLLMNLLGSVYSFNPLDLVPSLLGLSTPLKAVVDAKIVGQKLVVAYENGEVSVITSSGSVSTTDLKENILGIFGDNIVTTAGTYIASTLAKVKDVTGDVIPDVDVIGLLDTLPGVCTVMNILEDVVSRVSQKIDVYDTITNTWSAINIPTLADKVLSFAGTIDDCLIFTASNVVYIVNTTTSAVNTQFILDTVDNVVDDVRAFVQAPQLNGTVFVGIGGNLAEVTLTSSDLTVRADVPDLVVNHLCLLDDVVYVADIESTKMYFYDLIDNTWDSVELAGQTLVNYAIAAVNDTILIVGGNDGVLSTVSGVATDLSTVMLFHPINASLTVLDVNINARAEITPFSTIDAALFIGGQNSYGQPQRTVDIFSARTASTTAEPTVNPTTNPSTTNPSTSNPTTNTNTNPSTGVPTSRSSASTMMLVNVAMMTVAAITILF